MTDPTITEFLSRILSDAREDRHGQGGSEGRSSAHETGAKEGANSEVHGFMNAAFDAFQSMRGQAEKQDEKPSHPLSTAASIIGDFLDSARSEANDKAAKTNNFSTPGADDDHILNLIKVFGSEKAEQIKSVLFGKSDKNEKQEAPAETSMKSSPENRETSSYDTFTPQTPYSNRRYVLRESRQPVDGLWFARDRDGEYYKANIKVMPSGQETLLVWDYNTGKSLSSPSLDLVDAPMPATNTAMDDASRPQGGNVFMETVKILNEMNKIDARKDTYTPFRNSYLLRKSRQPVGDLSTVFNDGHNPVLLKTYMKSPISGKTMLFTWEPKTGKSFLMPALDLVDGPQPEAQAHSHATQSEMNRPKTWREMVVESARETVSPLAESVPGMFVSEIVTVGDIIKIVPIGSGVPGAKRIEWRFKI